MATATSFSPDASLQGASGVGPTKSLSQAAGNRDAAASDDLDDGVPADSVSQVSVRGHIEDDEIRDLARLEAPDFGGAPDRMGRVDRPRDNRLGRQETVVVARGGGGGGGGRAPSRPRQG